MNRRVATVLLLPVLLTACAKSRPSLEQAHAKAGKAYETAKTPQEKVAISREFLALYPESEFTMDELRPAVYYLVEPLDSPEEADALVTGLLDSIKAPELRREVMLARLRPLAALGDSDQLAATVEQVAAIHELSYSENSDVVDAALEAGSWQLALTRAEAGLAQADAATYRSDYPDRTFTEDEVRDAVERRLAGILAAKGWAQANLDRPDDGLATLAEAATHDSLQFTGDSANRIGSYRGRILHRLGRHAEAIEALAADALYGDDDEALATLREAYEALRGSADGLDEFLWSTRVATAKQVADFTLPDYQGQRHEFSELRNGRVTLLAFWFPT